MQKGITRVLEAIYEQDFLNCSYGFRPDRNCHDALRAVDQIIMKRPVKYVIEADIKGYFDNVSHDWLLRMLEVRIQDPSFLLLIRRFLKAGYVEEGQWIRTEQGTPQGGNLSPMVANIFLHYVLDLWFEKRIRPQAAGPVYLVRYADDFLIMAERQSDAQVMEPRGNKIKGKLSRSKNLARELKRSMTEEFRREVEKTFGQKSKSKSLVVRKKSRRVPKQHNKSDRPLAGMFPTGKVLYATFKGAPYKAWVGSNGRIKVSGHRYDSPSPAASAITHKSVDGWFFWKYKDSSGELQPLDVLRK